MARTEGSGTTVVRRRRILGAFAALAVASLSGAAAVARSALPARPRPSGTSTTRCAQCGASDHTMLDRNCPAAPKVIA